MRVTNSLLIEIAGKYNLSVEDIRTWKASTSNKSSSSGYWKKIGFQFIKTYQQGRKNDKIYFYGKMSDYNEDDIELAIVRALYKFKEFDRNFKNETSLFVYITKDNEMFIDSKNDDFFNSKFYIENIMKYL